MKTRQLLSLALFALGWTAGSSAWAWDEPTQVDGVYQIGTASELEWFAEYVNGTTSDMTTQEREARLLSKAVLTADIDMSGIDHQPIGATQALKYNGVFDGQHHVISNLVINRPSDSQLGLFGWVRGGTTLKNIIMDETCSITGSNRVGSIVGCVQTNASGDPLEILNCVSFATLKSANAAGMIGAGAEQYPYFEMVNCVNAGPITANNKASAFCGWNKSAGGNAKMYNCYNIADIGGSLDGGNIFFRGANREVKNCYDFGSTYSANAQVEKPTWKTADPLHSGELCYELNNKVASPNAGAIAYTQDLSDPNSIPLPVAGGKTVYLVGDLNCDGTPKGSFYYSNTSGGTRDAHTYSAESPYICTVCKAFNEEYVTKSEDGFYHLSTVDQVEWFSHMVRDKHHGAMNVKLDNDIDFGGVADVHLPIGSNGNKFFGHFDGQGHRILNMILTAESSSQLNNREKDGNGFFGSVRGGGTDANGTHTTGAIIENLIIDSSCSIEHDNNFAAGVVAHINTTEAGATIIIRNCGNEANVTSTGKNVAGILGCVESTNVGLKLYNLWNTGKITGKGGESAAICAWTGQRNVNGEVDVEGCWNIGEVDGVDVNDYNMIRHNSNIVPRNIVDLCIANKGNQGKVSVLNTENPIESGELCYLLNGDQTKIVYTQNIGEDEMPVYGTTSAQVYKKTIRGCGYPTDNVTYNNVREETIEMPHESYNEQGICAACHIGYQAPALVDGIYELSNAGNVEWFSALINSGTNSAKAKMTEDIDFTGVTHTPIGNSSTYKFNGEFDGQGHRITNLIYSNTDTECVGFFGWLRGNTAADGTNTAIRNLIIDKSCSFTGKNKVGALAGTVQVGGGTITVENVVNEANVESKSWDAGAIFGGENGGNVKYIIRNVVNTGNITSTGSAGALCCYLNVSEGSLIENFLNLGTITKTNEGRYNVGRHNINNTKNIIDLSNTKGKTQGVVDGLTADDVDSGKLAYYINSNDNQAEDAFFQTISSDAYPVPFNTSSKVETFSISSVGYATYSYGENFVMPTGVEGQIVKVEDDKYVTVTAYEAGDIVRAATGLLLKADEGAYYFNPTTADATIPEGSLLHAAVEAKTTDGGAPGAKYYKLANGSRGLGWYYGSASNTTGEAFAIGANKAYLVIEAGAEARAFISIFGDENETGIANVATESAPAVIYNLAGQRIQKMQKGVNVVNGKKVMF